MRINIIDYSKSKEGEKDSFLDLLCDDEWEMPEKIKALERWFIDKKKKFQPGNYIADLGYSPKEGANGGGAELTTEAMGVMVKIGMVLFLSEYPIFKD